MRVELSGGPWCGAILDDGDLNGLPDGEMYLDMPCRETNDCMAIYRGEIPLDVYSELTPPVLVMVGYRQIKKRVSASLFRRVLTWVCDIVFRGKSCPTK